MKNWKKVLSIVLAIIIIALFANYFYLKKGIKYQNEELGVELTYSQKWHAASDQELAKLNSSRSKEVLFKASIINNRQPESYFSITTQEVGINQIFDRDGSIRDMDAQLITKYPTFNKIKGKKVEFLGFEAIDYEFKYGSKAKQWHDHQIIFRADETVYRLIASAFKDDYQNHQLDFTQMFKTFQLKK